MLITYNIALLILIGSLCVPAGSSLPSGELRHVPYQMPMENKEKEKKIKKIKWKGELIFL